METDLNKLINKAFKRAKESRNILFRYRISIENNYKKYLSYVIENKNFFYFKYPKQYIYMGIGEEIKYTINKKDDLIRLNTFQKNNYQIISNIKDDYCTFFGASSFNISDKY